MLIGIEATHANKPNRTGVEEYSFQIIQHLKKNIPASMRVILYSNAPLLGDLAALPSNWSVKVLRWPFKKLWSQVRLSWEFLWHAPDVFFAPGQLIPFIVPKKTVATIHDSAFLVFPKAYHFFGRHYLRLMNWWILWRTQKVFTPSIFSKQEILRLYPQCAEEKIVVTPLGYDAVRFSPGHVLPNNFLSGQGIHKPYLLSIGRLEEKKNTVQIIAAFNLVKANQDVQLVLIGKPGVGYERIAETARTSPHAADIIQLGYVPLEQLPLFLEHAELFLFPSLYEGFGIPVLEAMAMGCPVVAGSGSSLAEVGGAAAQYVDPTDTSALVRSIEKVLSDSTFRQETRARGFAQVKLFSWQKTAEKTWNEIAKLL